MKLLFMQSILFRPQYILFKCYQLQLYTLWIDFTCHRVSFNYIGKQPQEVTDGSVTKNSIFTLITQLILLLSVVGRTNHLFFVEKSILIIFFTLLTQLKMNQLIILEHLVFSFRRPLILPMDFITIFITPQTVRSFSRLWILHFLVYSRTPLAVGIVIRPLCQLQQMGMLSVNIIGMLSREFVYKISTEKIIMT